MAFPSRVLVLTALILFNRCNHRRSSGHVEGTGHTGCIGPNSTGFPGRYVRHWLRTRHTMGRQRIRSTTFSRGWWLPNIRALMQMSQVLSLRPYRDGDAMLTSTGTLGSKRDLQDCNIDCQAPVLLLLAVAVAVAQWQWQWQQQRQREEEEE